MSWRDDFKKWNNRSLKDTLCPSYVFNKWIFITCMALVVVMGLFVMARHDFDFSNKFYFHCPENGGVCENPFFVSSKGEFYSLSYLLNENPCPVEDYSFCSQEFFFPGYTYGEQKSKDVALFPWFCVLIFLNGFFFNHVFFNFKKRSEVLK